LCASPVLEPALPKNYSICDFKILKKIQKCQIKNYLNNSCNSLCLGKLHKTNLLAIWSCKLG
jgi:hypothetical protein